jgi:hypothetical protein
MKRCVLLFILAALCCTIPGRSFAWGKKGHELVAEIAFHFLDDSTKQVVKKYLGNISIEDAANWMDDNRSNSYYDYMKTWHYLDMDKGEAYKGSSERNIITVLYSAITELRHMETMKKKDIRRDLLLIFHLIGDLHQPLHTGYAIDKGGNTVDISSQNFTSNLHSAWDTQIIETEGITLEKCLQVYASYSPQEVDTIKKINVLKWMYQTRSFLFDVYDYKNGFLDSNYIQRSTAIIKEQLVMGGLRLASILSELFKSSKPQEPLSYNYNIKFCGLLPEELV